MQDLQVSLVLGTERNEQNRLTMKRKHYFLILASTLLALVAASCSVGSDDDSSEFFSGDNGFYASDGETAEGASTGNGPAANTHAGVVIGAHVFW